MHSVADATDTSRIRSGYLDAAAIAVQLLEDPAVVASWDEPSALSEMPVSALAGHLARQIFSVQRLLSEPAGTEDPVTLLEHYARARWVGADLDDESNVTIRSAAAAEATDGPEALAGRAVEGLSAVRAMLAREPDERLVAQQVPWTLTVPDFLSTRLLELVVHCDDLAVSVGIPTPPMPAAAIDTVLVILLRIAVHRHGSLAVLRALSRAERSGGISAF